MIAEVYEANRQQQREDDITSAITSAYLTAMWGRVKKLPDLKKVLEDAKPKKIEPQTPEQMFAAVKRMHAQLAGEEG